MLAGRLDLTYPLARTQAHPVEAIFGNTLATLLGPLLFGSYTHPHVMMLYIGLKLWQSIETHSGYALPLPYSPWSSLPGMDHGRHYQHHAINKGNFGTRCVVGTQLRALVRVWEHTVCVQSVHDLSAHTGRAGGFFNWWDWLCNTDIGGVEPKKAA